MRLNERVISKFAVSAAVLITAAAVVLVFFALNLQDSSGSVARAPGPPITHAESAWRLGPDQTVEVVSASPENVVDGDSVTYRLSDGTYEEVRMIGIDAPELTAQKDKYGIASAEEVAELLRQHEIVFLELGASKRDRFGKLLAYVWLEKPSRRPSAAEVRGKMLNARMLLNGYARQFKTQPGVSYANVRYLDLFTLYLEEAKEAKCGMWDPEFAANAGPNRWLQPDPATVPITSNYVANATSRKFHVKDCENAKKMRLSNRVPFETHAAALSAGFVPCGICDP